MSERRDERRDGRDSEGEETVRVEREGVTIERVKQSRLGYRCFTILLSNYL